MTASPDLAHRAHMMSVGIVAWSLVLGVLVKFRQPVLLTSSGSRERGVRPANVEWVRRAGA